VEEKGAIAGELERHVWPLLARGDVRPAVHTTLPLDRASEAHRLLEAGDVIGKVVLTVSPAA
jgi:NADPH2:quinone reductase